MTEINDHPAPNWQALVHGAAELESTDNGIRLHRLPAWVIQQFPNMQLKSMEIQPAGVRLAFYTEASHVSLELLAFRTEYKGIHRERGRIDTYVDGELQAQHQLDGGSFLAMDPSTGQFATVPGQSQTIDIDLPQRKEKLVEIWLPHNESVWLRDLRADAQLYPVAPVPATRPIRWLHHGSSISQGSNATAPSEIWPAIVARNARVDLRNLGFGGGALLDPFMARVIRDAPADLITLKLGINIANHDSMTERSFVPALHGFLDTIRDGHPDTTIVVISPIYCDIHEHTPGPLNFDPEALKQGEIKFIATGNPRQVSEGKLTLQTIRSEMREALDRRSADPNLHFIDGLELYGENDATQLPLDDGLHPTPDIHHLIGQRFAELVAARTGFLHV